MNSVLVVISLGILTHYVKCNSIVQDGRMFARIVMPASIPKDFFTFKLSTPLEIHYRPWVNLSCEQIRAFVDGHNFRRWTVAQGVALGQPSAADMSYMVWDEELAEKAARWAEHGTFSHNPDKTIGSKRWPLVGENLFYSKFWSTLDIPIIPNIEEALNFWFIEHFDYGFYPFQLGTKKIIGHYTQMVWANSNRLGCGISQKKENGETFTLFVCNYGPTGNYIGQLPYTSSKFPGYLHCENGQCTKPYGYLCSY